MDNLIHAAILGLVQGLTEFLPISSSAHLILIPSMLGWNDPFADSTAFDVMLHMGTLAALLLYFRTDLWQYLRAWLASIRDRRIGDDPQRRIAWLLVISVVPAALLGAAFESSFDTTFRDTTRFAWIAVFILVGAALLWLAERWGSRTRGLEAMRPRDAAIIGVGQAIALFPGISRSGVTIATGLFLGLERDAAARFSFLMSVPVIAGAGIWKARTLVGAGLGAAQTGELVVGVLASAIFGFLAVAFLLSYLRGHGTGIFIAYRIGLAAVVFAFLLSR
jgi:undecaprenyl-diphosphatase